MLLKDKVAVITGAASGIGRATAELFAREGAKVVCTDINDTLGQQVVASLCKRDCEATYFHMDVTNPVQIRAVADACDKQHGLVDVLFNNAGRWSRQNFEATTEDDWQEMVGVNLTGAFVCSKYFLPLMKKAGAGSIINHASIDGILGNPAIAAYSAAKGGLIPLTHVMAHDLGKYHIRVNSLATGGISTASREKAEASGMPHEARIALTPLQRWGTPEEAANVALFFASDMASFVNGATLVVDGGRTAITQGTYSY